MESLSTRAEICKEAEFRSPELVMAPVKISETAGEILLEGLDRLLSRVVEQSEGSKTIVLEHHLHLGNSSSVSQTSA